MSPTSQNGIVAAYLKKYRVITCGTAIDRWRITRLSARIYDLKDAGWKIQTIMLPNKGRTSRHALYRVLSWPKEVK